jgi:sulfatase modifying factor 1
MGSVRFYPEECPVRLVEVDALWFDDSPVTNADFHTFLAAAGYVTVAEQTPDARDIPDADPALLVPGSQVFVPTSGPVPLHEWTRWWQWVPGANWRHPEGPDSDLLARNIIRSCT